jgi:hypothetical protein
MKKILISIGVTLGLMIIYLIGVFGASYFMPAQISFGAPDHTNIGNASSTSLTLSGKLYDADGDVGSSGQVLSSTGSATNWITNVAASFPAQLGQIGDVSTNTPEVWGDMLIYNTNTSKWESVATSTLGVTASLTATYPILYSGGNLSFPATSTLYGTGNYGEFLMWGTQPTWTPTSTLSLTKSQIVDFGTYLTTIGSGTNGNLAYWNGANTLTDVATSTLAVGASLSSSGTLGYQVGGTASTLSLNMANPNSWTGQQTFLNASTTNLTVSGYIRGSAEQLTVQKTASTTLSTVEDFFTLYSVGKLKGGEITDIGGGNVAVNSGSCTIATGPLEIDKLVFSDFAASSTIAIPTNTTRWIGVEYNAGVPRVVVYTDETSYNFQDTFPLGIVSNENGVLDIINNPRKISDAPGMLIQRFHQTLPISRDERRGGLIIGESGTRNVTLSAGRLWDRSNEFIISATSTAWFQTYWRDGGTGFSEQINQTQWPNTAYDDGDGVLGTVASNRYANLWWYLELNGQISMVYGRNVYTSVGAAVAGSPPNTIPTRLSEGARLIARTTFQGSGATWSDNTSFWTTTVLGTAVTNHANLVNLNWGAAGHTFDTNLNLGAFNLLTTGTVYATSSMFVNASTTLLSTSYASSTSYYGAGLTACNGATNALTWNGGTFGCNAIASASVVGTVSTSSIPTIGQLAYWNSAGYPSLLGSVATTSPTFGLGLTTTGTWTVLGSSPTLTIATTSLFTGSTGQLPYFSGTNTLTGTSTITINANGIVSIGTSTPLTLTREIISSPGTSLTLRQTGDTYGTSSLILQNRGGSGGALFYSEGYDLVDFGFKPLTGYQSNLRYEHRSTNIISSLNSALGEFQFIDDSTGTASYFLGIGKAATVLAYGNLGVGTTSPYARFSLVGNSSQTNPLFVVDYGDGTATTTAFSISSNGTLNWGTNTGVMVVNAGEVSAIATSSNGLGLDSIIRFSYPGTATSTWTATSTLKLGVAQGTETYKWIKCVTSAGTLNININDGTNRSNVRNASTTGNANWFTSNNVFTDGEVIYFEAGTPASSPAWITCTAKLNRKE